jgi:hypothetical protein
MALLAVLDGRELSDAVTQAGALLATVTGQDLDRDEAGVFRIARRVAKDRVISTVDPQARHGHKTAARGFDGYKGHVGIDPDTEIITATTVTPGNTGDGATAADLITDLIPVTHPTRPAQPDTAQPSERADSEESAQPDTDRPDTDRPSEAADSEPAPGAESSTVFGDCAYGSGEFQATLESHGIASGCKTQVPAPRPGGLFTKARLRHRPRPRHRRLPGRGHHPDPPPRRRQRGHRALRRGLPPLPAARPVHHLGGRSHRHCQRL